MLVASNWSASAMSDAIWCDFVVSTTVRWVHRGLEFFWRIKVASPSHRTWVVRPYFAIKILGSIPSVLVHCIPTIGDEKCVWVWNIKSRDDQHLLLHEYTWRPHYQCQSFASNGPRCIAANRPVERNSQLPSIRAHRPEQLRRVNCIHRCTNIASPTTQTTCRNENTIFFLTFEFWCMVIYLENMISDVVDLNSWHVAIAQFWAEHTLKAWRCSDQNDFVSVEYFTLDPMCTNLINCLWQRENEMKSLSHLNITSLSSGLLTNFGSIRVPLTGCNMGSLIGFMVSQPKHVAKMSANKSVVPSF